MIKAVSYLPDAIEEISPLTLTLTMTVKEWRELMAAMPTGNATPAAQLGMIISRSIGTSISRLTAKYHITAWAEHEDEQPTLTTTIDP